MAHLSTHSIQKLIFDIDYPSEKAALDFQHNFAEYAKRRLSAIILEILDELDQPNVFYQIETLEIDLGDIDLKEWTFAIDVRLKSLLKAKLSELLPSAMSETLAPEEAAPDMQGQSPTEIASSILETYLLTGNVPWWTYGAWENLRNNYAFEEDYFSVSQLIPFLLLQAPETFQRLVSNYNASNAVRIRWISLLADEALAQHFVPQLSYGYIQTLLDVFLTEIPSYLPQMNPTRLRETIWLQLMQKERIQFTTQDLPLATSTVTLQENDLLLASVALQIYKETNTSEPTKLQRLKTTFEKLLDDLRLPNDRKTLLSRTVSLQLLPSKRSFLEAVSQPTITPQVEKNLLGWFQQYHPAIVEFVQTLLQELTHWLTTLVERMQWRSPDAHTHRIRSVLWSSMLDYVQSYQVASWSKEKIAKSTLETALQHIKRLRRQHSTTDMPVSGLRTLAEQTLRLPALKENLATFEDEALARFLEEPTSTRTARISADILFSKEFSLLKILLEEGVPSWTVQIRRLLGEEAAQEETERIVSRFLSHYSLVLRNWFLQNVVLLPQQTDTAQPDRIRLSPNYQTRLQAFLSPPTATALIREIERNILFAQQQGLLPASSSRSLESILQEIKQNPNLTIHYLLYYTERGVLPEDLQPTEEIASTLLNTLFDQFPAIATVFWQSLSTEQRARLEDQLEEKTLQGIDDTQRDKATLLTQVAEEEAKLVAQEKERLKALEEIQPVEEEEVKKPSIYYIFNAGIAILHPYLMQLFRRLALIENKAKEFKDEIAQHKAVYILEYMASGRTEKEVEEHELAFNKVLCGLSPNASLDKHIVITEEERSTCESLLEAVIQHWSVLKSTSTESLRASFLLRNGRLTEELDFWLVKVEEGPFDMLLQHIPWGISQVFLPWLEKYIVIDWIE